MALLVNVPLFCHTTKYLGTYLRVSVSYVKGTNIYVIRGGGATFEARGWGLERKCFFT